MFMIAASQSDVTMAFGRPGAQASWYDNVRQITVRFNTAIAHTDLTDSPSDQEKVDTICRVVARFQSTARGQQRRGIDVQGYGQNRQLLASSHDTTARPASRIPSRPGL
jgi:hypothetical protein